MRYGLWGVCLTVASLSWASGCSGGGRLAPPRDPGPPVRGGTLKVIGNSDVDHLATTSAYTNTTWSFFRTITRQLVSYPASPDFEVLSSVVPDLAMELPTIDNGGLSADARTYTFHLRQGVRWDTTPPRAVTAGDEVRAMQLLCNPVNPVGAPGYCTSTIVGMKDYCDAFAKVPGTVADIQAFIASHSIAGVMAPDDTTVVFHLIEPASDFLNILALPFATPVPVEYLDYLPDGPEFRQHTISDGPYRITKYRANREIVLDRNPSWDPASDPLRPAYVDRIEIALALDQQLVQLQLAAGTADVSWDQITPTAEMASLLEIGDPNLIVAPLGDYFVIFRYLAVNQVGLNNNGALKRREVRQALQYAIDKRALVQILGGPDVARPMRQAVMKSTTGFRPGGDRYVTEDDRGDPAKARQMLAAAGYPNGLPLTLAYYTSGAQPLLAATIQASLTRAGFTVRLTPYTAAEFYGRLLERPENARRGVWDLALAGWVPDWFGKSNGRSLIEPLFDGRNFDINTQDSGGYNSDRVNALIDRATVATSVDSALDAWTNAAQIVMDDAGIVPLVEFKEPHYHSSRTQGCAAMNVFSFNCDFTTVWLAGASTAREAGR